MQQGRHDEPDSGALRIQNDRAAIERLESALLGAAERRGYPDASRFALRLALEEALVNAFRHGHREKPEEPVDVSWAVEPERVTITVQDQGPGFDPGAVPDPTDDANIERPSGRGLMLIRAYMSRVEFNERGNRVCMVYVRPRTGGRQAR